MFFKVTKKDASRLKDINIKLKNDDTSEYLLTDEKGEAKTSKKYKTGTSFQVTFSEVGYKVVERQITVRELEDKNKIEVQLVSMTDFLMHFIVNTFGPPNSRSYIFL